MKTRTIPMAEIKRRYNPEGLQDGFHWFDKDTMRFFATKLPAYGYEGDGGILFITSEQLAPNEPRKWSVRQLVKPGHINTAGDFNGHHTAYAARTEAMRLAGGEI